jgi:hypothetical protein
MTYEGAYAVKQEDYIGTVELGKFADLIILTGDPLTVDPNDLWELEVLLTMVGGKIEYQSNQFTLLEDQADEETIFNIPGYNPIVLIGIFLCVSAILIIPTMEKKIKNKFKPFCN